MIRKFGKKSLLSAILLCVLVVATVAYQFGVNVTEAKFSGVGSAMPRYNEITMPFSYLIDTNGTNYFLGNGTTWKWDAQSTNSTYIFSLTIKANVSVALMRGSYSVNNLLPLGVLNYQLKGENWGAQINVGVNGGWNISSASVLRNIHFENIWFEGSGTAVRLITSAMPANIRIDSFVFTHNRVNNFYGAGAIGLNMSNLENSEISYNTWYRTRIAHIQMTTNRYDSGNVRIIGNEFYYGYNQAGENAVRMITKQKDPGAGDTGNGGGVQVFASFNHYLDLTYAGYAWNVTTYEGKCSVGPQLENERLEGGGFIVTKTRNSTYFVKGLKIIGSQLLNTAFTGVKLINLDSNTWDSIIDANYLLNTGSSPYTLMDNNTSSSTYNIFSNNWVASTTGFSPSVTTYVHGNAGISTTYNILKGTGISNFATTNKLTNYGATTTTLTSKTKYTVHTNDVYITISGGTVTNIILYDPAGTQIADYGSSMTFVLVPRLCILNVTYSVAPTITALWVS